MIDRHAIRPPLTVYRVTRTAEAIAQTFLVRTDAILGPDRGNAIIGAARLALYTLLYEQTSASTVEIGKRLKRDHSTVLAGMKRVAQWKEIAPAWHQALNDARKSVRP